MQEVVGSSPIGSTSKNPPLRRGFFFFQVKLTGMPLQHVHMVQVDSEWKNTISGGWIHDLVT